MKKKLLSLALAASMSWSAGLSNMIPIAAQEVSTFNDANTWDGSTTTTDWYTSNVNAASYSISTAAQLAGLAQLVNTGNTFSGKTISLESDINLNDLAWTPIGRLGYRFAGTFEGNEHTISRININIKVSM